MLVIINQMKFLTLLTITTLVIVIFDFSLAINNVFNPTSTIITFDPPGKTSGPGKVNPKEIVDGLISPSKPTGSWGECTGSSKTASITLSNSVQARTILTLVGTDTTSEKDCQLSLDITFQNGTVLSQKTGVGPGYPTNIVYYAGQLLSIQEVSLNAECNKMDQLCTPELLVVDEHPLYNIGGLNPTTGTQYSSCLTDYKVNNVNTGSRLCGYSSQNNWKIEDTSTNNCWTTQQVPQSLASFYTYIFPESSPGCANEICQAKNLVLLTSILIVTGPKNTQPNIEVYYIDVSSGLDFQSRTFTNQGYYAKLIQKIGASTILDVANPSTGEITTRVKIVSNCNTCTVSLCKVVPLGYPYCFIDGITDTTATTNSFIINLANPQPAITKIFQIRFYIDTAKTITNLLFCSLGYSATLSCSNGCAMPTYTISYAQDGKISVSLQTANVSLQGTQTYILTVVDSRNKIQTTGKTFSFSITYTVSCLDSVIVGALPKTSPFDQSGTQATYYVSGLQYTLSLQISQNSGCSITVSNSFIINTSPSTSPQTLSYSQSFVANQLDYGIKTGVSSQSQVSMSWYSSDTALLNKALTVTIIVNLRDNNANTNRQLTRSFTLSYKLSCSSTSFNSPVFIGSDVSQNGSIDSTVRTTLRAYNLTADTSGPSYNNTNYLITAFKEWQFSDTTSVAQGSINGCSYCGGRTYTLTTTQNLAQQAITEDVVIITPSTDTYSVRLQVYAYDSKYSGQNLSYTLSSSLSLTPSVTPAQFSVNVQIDPCQVQAVNASPSTFSDYEYSLNSNFIPEVISINQYPDCQYEYSFTLSVNQITQSSLTSNTYGFFVESTTSDSTTALSLSSTSSDPFLFGGSVYSVKIDMQFATYQSILSAPVKSFALNVLYSGDVCPFTKLNSITLKNMNTTVFSGQTQTQLFSHVTDSASQYFGNQDGLTYCGDRTYSVTQPFSFINLQKNKQTLILSSINAAEVGIWNVTLTAALANYPDVQNKSYSFQVVIDPCQIKSVSVSNTNLVYSYSIGSGGQFYQLPAYLQYPACNYSIVSFSQTNDQNLSPSAISFITSTMFVQLDNVRLSSLVLNLQITAEFNDPTSFKSNALSVRLNIIPKQLTSSSTTQTQKSITPNSTNLEDAQQKPSQNSSNFQFDPSKYDKKANSSQIKDVANKTVYYVQSVSQLGIVLINFSTDLILPYFVFGQEKDKNSSGSQFQASDRDLSATQAKSVHYYINNKTLDVKLYSLGYYTNLNWTCMNWTTRQLTLQVYFSDPLQISQVLKQPDQLHVKIMQPQYFVSNTTYLTIFQEGKDFDAKIAIPQQIQSKQQEDNIKKQAAAIQNGSIATIVITLIIQYFSKKVISKLFEFYCTLQLILLIHLKGAVNQPVNVVTFLDAIWTIVYMKFDLKILTEYVKIPVPDLLIENQYLKLLGSLALVGIVVILVTIAVILGIKFSKSSKVLKIVRSIRDSLFWGFFIRYLQTAFLNTTYAAFLGISSDSSLNSLLVSCGILFVLILVLVSIVRTLLLNRPYILDMEASKKKIGALYEGLRLESKLSLLYGTTFFLNRTLIAAVLVFQQDFSLQYGIILQILLGKIIYLLVVKPYTSELQSSFELANLFILLAAQYLQRLMSPYVMDNLIRNTIGDYFNMLVVFNYLLNFGILIFFILDPKVKQAYLKYKQRQHRRSNRQIMKLPNTFGLSQDESGEFDQTRKLKQSRLAADLKNSNQSTVSQVQIENPQPKFGLQTPNKGKNQLRIGNQRNYDQLMDQSQALSVTKIEIGDWESQEMQNLTEAKFKPTKIQPNVQNMVRNRQIGVKLFGTQLDQSQANQDFDLISIQAQQESNIQHKYRTKKTIDDYKVQVQFDTIDNQNVGIKQNMEASKNREKPIIVSKSRLAKMAQQAHYDEQVTKYSAWFNKQPIKIQKESQSIELFSKRVKQIMETLEGKLLI